MAKLSRPRRGSLQYWPRKRSKKSLPSVSWTKISSENISNKLMGFIGYKVGMKSAYVKNSTPDSMTKNKRIVVPVTIIECPPMKIFSVRFYKYGIVANEVLAQNLDKELKRKVKLPKNYSKKIEDIKDYDDIKIIVYSIVKTTGIKKSPDISEIALGGSLDDKINFVKEHLNKEIKVKDIFNKMQLVDIRGITKGKGLEGAVKRFGIGLRSHKAEKTKRGIATLGSWKPKRVEFTVANSGKMGYHQRTEFSKQILKIGS